MADGVQGEQGGTTDPVDREALAWRLEGMDCASCVAKVEGVLARMPGVSGVEVNLMGERLVLRLDRSGGPEATPAAVERRLAAIGHPATRLPSSGIPAADTAREAASEVHAAGKPHLHAHGEDDEDTAAEGKRWWQSAKGRLVLGLGALVAAAWGLSHLVPREAYWIYLAATLVALWLFGRRAVALARAGSPFSIEDA